MKKMTKLLALLLALVMIAVCFTGCGRDKGNTADAAGNSATDIAISYWNAGYGSEWIEKTVARFEKAYPEYKVELTASASDAGLIAAFGLADIDDTDIYMVSFPLANADMMEPLNGIFDMTAKGDSVKLSEKFDATYLKNSTFDNGDIYVLPTVSNGSMSMVYNKKMFADNNLSIPRTTSEMAVVADALAAKGIPAFISFKGAGYWNMALNVWYAQYEGLDYYINNFYACKDEKGVSPSIEVFTKEDGRYEILKALEGFLTPKYVLAGSNSQTHTVQQTEFIHGKGAMMYNGGWLENEAKTAGTMEDFGVFRLPVISSITKKLSTVKSEGDLRRLITAVDSVVDGKATEDSYKSGNNYVVEGSTVSANDWNYILEARTTTYGSQIDNGVYIPEYSTAKDAAKTFVAYMYSDENLKAIATEQHYTFAGIKKGYIEIDTSDWTPLSRDFYNQEVTYKNFVSSNGLNIHEIFTDGGASLFPVDFIPHYCTNNPADRWTSDMAWNKLLAEVNAKYKVTWLANIT